MLQFLLSSLNQGICPVLNRVVLKRSKSDGHCGSYGTPAPIPAPALGTVLISLLSKGLHNDNMAYGDAYCCGHTSGVAIWEIMLLMSGFS